MTPPRINIPIEDSIKKDLPNQIQKKVYKMQQSWNNISWPEIFHTIVEAAYSIGGIHFSGAVARMQRDSGKISIAFRTSSACHYNDINPR